MGLAMTEAIRGGDLLPSLRRGEGGRDAARRPSRCACATASPASWPARRHARRRAGRPPGAGCAPAAARPAWDAARPHRRSRPGSTTSIVPAPTASPPRRGRRSGCPPPGRGGVRRLSGRGRLRPAQGGAGGRARARRGHREMESSNLRGLGGAGFPAGRKWTFVRMEAKPRPDGGQCRRGRGRDLQGTAGIWSGAPIASSRAC